MLKKRYPNMSKFAGIKKVFFAQKSIVSCKVGL